MKHYTDEPDDKDATIAKLRAKIASAIATWDDLVTFEPCATCGQSGVGLISYASDEAMDSAIDGLRDAIREQP